MPGRATQSECQHRWSMPTRLPRGTQQWCRKCRAWRVLTDDGREVIIPYKNLVRFDAMMRTLEQIEALPEDEQ